MNKHRPLLSFLSIRTRETEDSRNFVIHVRGPLDSLARSIQCQVADLSPSLLVEFKVLDLQIRQSVLRERLMANLSGAFGLLAACLSTLGLYGVMSYIGDTTP